MTNPTAAAQGVGPRQDRLKHCIHVDQLVLAFWIGKRLDPSKLETDNGDLKNRTRYLSHTFDAIDALLVSLIEDLNDQDEAVRRIMFRGHFLLTLNYVAERLPILQLGEGGIYRRLRWLKMMGILSCIHKTVDGSKILAYYKCSDLYWKIKAKRHQIAARALTKEAVTPKDHKAIGPVDMSHRPQGLLSLSNIGKITLPASAEAACPRRKSRPYPSPGLWQRSRQTPKRRACQVSDSITRILLRRSESYEQSGRRAFMRPRIRSDGSAA